MPQLILTAFQAATARERDLKKGLLLALVPVRLQIPAAASHALAHLLEHDRLVPVKQLTAVEPKLVHEEAPLVFQCLGADLHGHLIALGFLLRVDVDMQVALEADHRLVQQVEQSAPVFGQVGGQQVPGLGRGQTL